MIMILDDSNKKCIKNILSLENIRSARVSMVKFNLVIIKEQGAEKYFFGKIPSKLPMTGSRLIANVCEYGIQPVKRGIYSLEQVSGEPVYKKLFQRYTELGVTGFTARRFNVELSRDLIEVKIWECARQCIAQHGEDSLLNDRLINPEKVMCECGMRVRKELLSVHKEKYCSAGSIGDFGFNSSRIMGDTSRISELKARGVNNTSYNPDTGVITFTPFIHGGATTGLVSMGGDGQERIKLVDNYPGEACEGMREYFS